MEISIICTTDENYLPLFKTFLNSLKANGNIDYNIICRFINCECPPMSHVVNAINDSASVSSKRDKLIAEGMTLGDTINVRKHSKTLYRGARWLYSDKMAYCANIKFNTINKSLNRGTKYIFYFDVDTIIRDDISEFMLQLADTDILIKATEGNPDKPVTEPYGVLYHTGMIGIRNSEITRQFFSELEERVKTDMYNWDTDQIQFAEMVEKYKDSISIRNIDDIYKDENFNGESVIWCGAGTDKCTNDKYVNEMLRYKNDNT